MPGPGSRGRRIAAVAIVAVALVVAFYIIVIGALARLDTGGLSVEATALAVAVVIGGIAAAAAVLRSGRPDRSGGS